MGNSISSTYTQAFPPVASLTEHDLSNQSGRVFVVTGGNSGVGFALCKILYHAGGTVYMASRSQSLAHEAIEEIEASSPPPSQQQRQSGAIKFLHIDLADLNSVRDAANELKQRERRVDVLWNNAGVSVPPTNSVSAQGHELALAVNCLGPFLFTQLLLPLLQTDASSEASPRESAATRVIWTGSLLIDLAAPPGGLDVANLNHMPQTLNQKITTYSATKAGNYFLSVEFAKRYPSSSTGIVSLTQNPGNLKTRVWRGTDWLTYALYWPLLYDAINGAYTMLWAGLTEKVERGDSGRYVIPWGRWHPGMRRDVEEGTKRVSEGGTGRAEEFWEWCEEKTRDYM